MEEEIWTNLTGQTLRAWAVDTARTMCSFRFHPHICREDIYQGCSLSLSSKRVNVLLSDIVVFMMIHMNKRVNFVVKEEGVLNVTFIVSYQ